MMYRVTLLASSLLATLPFTAFAQQAPAVASSAGPAPVVASSQALVPAPASSAAAAPAAPKAITIMPGPPGNGGNAGVATSAAAVPAVSSVTMGLGAGAGTGVGGTNLSMSGAGPPGPANTAGVIGSGQVAVWVVKVGSANNDLVFSPNSVTAKVGEMVQFQFYSKVCSRLLLFRSCVIRCEKDRRRQYTLKHRRRNWSEKGGRYC
jgi:plastocyanin